MFFFTRIYKTQFSGDFNHFLAILILSIYPITFFMGSGFVNLCVILIDLLLIFEILRKKKFSFFQNITFYYLNALWFILLISLFFSVDPLNSSSRSFGFIRFIFFIMAIIYYFNTENQKYQKIILSCWTLIFFIVNIDLIYEFFVGQNILGYKSYMPGRLAGFYNDELKIGHFYYGFSLIILMHVWKFLSMRDLNLNIKKIFNINLIYLIAFTFILISFLIGERSNFIKTFIMIFFFIFFLEKKNIKKKLIIFLGIISIFAMIINSSPWYKSRILNQLIIPLVTTPISYFSSSQYGEHYKFGIKIFLDNKLFGVGLKNYRNQASNYYHEDGKDDVNSSIHPHQTHFEILSELGIIGYLTFVVFFALNFRNLRTNLEDNNKYYKIAGLLFILTTFIPLLPSGSFFTSHAAVLFWMNFAFMNFSQENTKI